MVMACSVTYDFGMTNKTLFPKHSKAFASAFLSAVAMTAILATVGVATNKASKPAKAAGQFAKQVAPVGPPPTMAQQLAKRNADRDARQAKIAAALNVSGADLAAAFKAVKSDSLAAKVAANQLTEAQKVAILACDEAALTCDRSDLPARGPHGRPAQAKPAMAAALAAKLNLPTATVQSVLKEYAPGMRKAPRGPQL